MTDALYAGIMSGTSLDGVDAVVAAFPEETGTSFFCKLRGSAFVPFPATLRSELLALQASGADELVRSARAANTLADLYAQATQEAARQAGVELAQLRAVGVHGQTVRHCPAEGWSCQLNHPARLAEHLGIDVVADFRSRDLAAGGQGAPLVPAFHTAMFGSASKHRVIVNIGGIANLTDVPPQGAVRGFDTGPGNVLLDAWTMKHQKGMFDRDGAWAASGYASPALLAALLSEPFFRKPPPKSTGRDLFHSAWLDAHLASFPSLSPADVQATLLQLTATSIAEVIPKEAEEIFICGGGAYNTALMNALSVALIPRAVQSTEVLGVSAQHVEALAFAWLARETLARRTGNLPAVTGAKGARILGAVYPGCAEPSIRGQESEGLL
ncbi:MAG: anhydro-N-acetylmuramic acid kinase [Proteobacteria bacterium]|nr:anhydro-N-acetylmuramic acid kinase [Pseudomonadota bacterium]MCL2308048.1 anhydro-N-acetylmuramic acid kinase [Pseudomonadota bacterium]